MSHKYIFKYIIIGDMSVGKSCLLQRFTEQRFRKDLPHTIGVDFGTTIVEVNGEYVKMQIWDTAGQERFRSLTRNYYRGAAAALLVYDVSRRETFSHVSTWLQEVKANTSPHTTVLLLGNKADLEEEREVSYEEASQFAAENDILFLECSALSGSNVEQAFLTTAHKIHEKVLSGVLSPTDPESGVQLHAATLGARAAQSQGSTAAPVEGATTGNATNPLASPSGALPRNNNIANLSAPPPAEDSNAGGCC